ncbi:FCD domain-containing protein [Tianweitania sediminis]|uniref:FCD domain-containing protein n=1 Tax=Tianweitania sediminis TaxID=1502156 RepID=A0A8J7R2Y5_9HYPH|nr:FCD domain-containing protein [Tianweitania sediminis]
MLPQEAVKAWTASRLVPHYFGIVVGRRAQPHEESGQDDEFISELNWKLHRSLYRPSGRRATLDMPARIQHQLERYTRLMVSLAELNKPSDREH